ncbi:MAG: NUDIX domain-containing protein [Pseudomonadales bacterium]
MAVIKTQWQPSFTHADVQILDEQVVGQHFHTLKDLHIRHRSFSGADLNIQRDLLQRQDAVAVLLYDAILDAVVLVEQFRVGALGHPTSAWLLEVVAGLCDCEGSPEEVARREVQEEAGLEVKRLQHLYRYAPSPGAVAEYIDLYLGEVDAREAGGVHGLASECEDIKVHLLDATSAIEMLASGQIDSSPAIIALQWLALNRAELQQLRLREGG